MPTTAIVASQILDSGLTGRELIQAADQAAAQAIIGVDPSQYGLLSANNTWTGFNTFQDDLTASFISAASIDASGSITVAEDLEVQGGMTANGAEFYGEVEFTSAITGVGGEHQGDLTISQNSDMIVTGGGGYKLYNLGTEGDTDTEYLGIRYGSGHDVTISTNATGSGVGGKMYFSTGGSTALNLTLSSIYIYRNFVPSSSGSLVCGASSLRWGGVYSVDGSYSGNLNVEAGGSQRVYNLGTEGDTDTEYLETSFDTNVATIEPKATGTGTLREVHLVAGNSSVEVKNGLSTVKAGGYNVFRGSGSSSTYLYGFNNGTIIDIGDGVFSAFSANCDLGSDTKRWANTYSVAGNFSGTITAPSVFNSNGGTGITLNANDIRFSRNGLGQRMLMESTNLRSVTDGDMHLGTSSFRWGNTYSVDGNFSGTVTTDAIDSTGSLIVSNNGTQKLEVTATRIRPSVNFFPLNNDFVVCGQEGSRWKSVASVDGSFSGNLNTEVGGSQRVYNLGTDGDTDTEFLSIGAGTANGYGIYTNATGTGLANRQIEIRTNARKSGVTVKADSVEINANTTSFPKFVVQSSSTYSRSDFRPFSSGTYSCGNATYRWANVASVDGDFSGTVTANAFVGDGSGLTGLPGGNPFDQDLNTTDSPSFVDGSFSGVVTSPSNLTLQSNNAQAKVSLANSGGVTITALNSIYQQFVATGVSYRQPCHPTFDGSVNLGLETLRWAGTYSVNGSFSGNLNVESGGSQRVYNLGTEGDPGTEYLETSWDTNECIIQTKSTGAGSNRNLSIGTASNNNGVSFTAAGVTAYTSGTSRLSVTDGDIRCYKPISGYSGATLGVSTRRWSTGYFADGDFSGDVAAANFTSTVGAATASFSAVDPATGYPRALFTIGSTGASINNVAMTIAPDVTGVNQEISQLEITTNPTDTTSARKSLFFRADTSAATIYATNGLGGTSDIPLRFNPNGVSGAHTFALSGTNAHFTCDVSVDGNLNTEVGGSNRIFNLGSDADVAAGDTEYLSISWQSDNCKFKSQTTGTGVERRLDFEGSGIRYIAAGITVADISAGDVRLYSGRTIRPLLDNDASVGKTSHRFTNVYSYDGSFSGNLSTGILHVGVTASTTGAYDSEIHNRLLFKSQSSRAFTARDSSNTDIFNINTSQSVVTAYGDMVVGNNLITEVGGSQRVYGLGTEGDTDTEYLSTEWDVNTYYIEPTKTGSGTYRNLYLQANNRLYGVKILTNSVKIEVNNQERLSLNATSAVWTYDQGSTNGSDIGTVSQPFGDCNLSGNATVGIDGRVNWGNTATSIKRSGTSLYWSIGGLTALTAHCGGSSKKLHWNENQNQDIDFIVGYNGGRGIDMDGATGRVAFGTGIITEVGGSQRVYNLGTDGDTDTEYLETSFDTNVAKISSKATGTGVQRNIEIDAPVVTVSGDVYATGYLKGSANGHAINLAESLVSESALRTSSGGGTALAWGYGGSGTYIYSAVQHRFVGGLKLQGDAISEVGTSYKLYNLGTEGDTDTEYLETSNNGTRFAIDSKATGSGVAKDISIAKSGSRAMTFKGNAGVDSKTILPILNSAYTFGSDTFRWAAAYIGGLTTAAQTVTGTSALLGQANHTTFCDCTSNAITINLPAASVAGRQYIIKKIDATANAVTIDGNGSETIDGATTMTLTSQYQSLTLVSDGTNWFIV